MFCSALFSSAQIKARFSLTHTHTHRGLYCFIGLCFFVLYLILTKQQEEESSGGEKSDLIKNQTGQRMHSPSWETWYLLHSHPACLCTLCHESEQDSYLFVTKTPAASATQKRKKKWPRTNNFLLIANVRVLYKVHNSYVFSACAQPLHTSTKTQKELQSQHLFSFTLQPSPPGESLEQQVLFKKTSLQIIWCSQMSSASLSFFEGLGKKRIVWFLWLAKRFGPKLWPVWQSFQT